MNGNIQILRPKQWVKNGLVWMPLVFSSHFLSVPAIHNTFLAFVFFCITASSVYILNDICDQADDFYHPIKSKVRPLASGALSPKQAYYLLFFLYALLVGILILFPKFILPIISYVILNIFYSFIFKNEPIIDIFLIAMGFVIRIYMGAVAIDVSISGWMFITTFSLALYLAAIKRKQELLHHSTTSRNVLERYSSALIDKYADISAYLSIMFYSLFVMSVRPELIFTIPITLFGIFRYWYVVEQYDQGESPTDVIFEDGQLLLTILIWLGASLWILWPTG